MDDGIIIFDGKIKLFWQFIDLDKSVNFLIKANLKGWIGLAFGQSMGSSANKIDMIIS